MQVLALPGIPDQAENWPVWAEIRPAAPQAVRQGGGQHGTGGAEKIGQQTGAALGAAEQPRLPCSA